MPALAEDEYSARDQTAGEAAVISADSDEPAPHVGADFIARFSGDEDSPAAHAKPAAAIARADEMAGVAADVDQTDAHFGADPIARFPINLKFTSGISAPRCMPALPWMVMRPDFIRAPIKLTRLQSPSMLIC